MLSSAAIFFYAESYPAWGGIQSPRCSKLGFSKQHPRSLMEKLGFWKEEPGFPKKRLELSKEKLGFLKEKLGFLKEATRFPKEARIS